MRARIQIFNHPAINGRIYTAETKDEVFEFFNKPNGLLLTSQDQTTIAKKDFGIDEEKIIGKFENIEVVDTGDIGYNGYPIFEVYAEINDDSNLSEKFKPYKEMYENNIATFGMRAIGTVSKDSVVTLERVICFDMITK